MRDAGGSIANRLRSRRVRKWPGHVPCSVRFRMRTGSYTAAAKVQSQSTRRVPPMPQLPQQPDRLEPAEDLFNELALLLAHQISGVARGVAVDRTRPVRRVLGHVRCPSEPAQGVHESVRVIAFIVKPGGNALAISRPASRSAVPVACVASALTTKPYRVSIIACPAYDSFASRPLPSRASRASWSVVEAWVSLLRRSPWKSTVGLPGSSGGRAASSFRLKLLSPA